ncbi:MAG: insulinase family protein [Fimbriimonadaceae bacterium]|nr:insulinase family protein [Fimbriimonadaceae bacterium]
MEPIQKTVLANGVRVLTERIDHVGSASIGVWCRTGSTHENADEAGITHLIEHMLFKGTPQRTAKEIAESIEGRGGMLNAFTDKEQTCYYCRTLAEDAGNGLDVLTDMVRHSLIDPKELATEKGVVIEEIKRSEDEPGDHVHDLHLEGLWPDHELGLPVIGTRESVGGFEQKNLKDYIARRYVGANLVVAAAGKVDHDEFVRLTGQALGDLPAGEADAPLARPTPSAGDNLVAKDVEQVHFCIGTRGTSQYDDDLYAGVILDGVLGSGMSSRLFQEVREKRGLVYSIGSYHMAYSSGGAFTVYGGTGLETWQQVREVVRAEFDKMMADGPTEGELTRAKKLIGGNMVLGLESTSNRMMRLARNELVHRRHIPMEETKAKIDAVTAAEVVGLARRILGEEQVRTTAIGPF